MASISVVIVAQDEERTLGDVLNAARPLAQEIVLVDSGSTDGTLEIARSFKARIFHQQWLGYSAQKNFAIDLAAGDWILSLDADEILTPELVAEIEARLASKDLAGVEGFLIPRVLYIGETAVRHGGFYPDAQLRLFRRGKGRFRDRLVHEAVILDGKALPLKNAMHHRAYKDVEGFRQAMEKYARLSAREAVRSGFSRWQISNLNELLHPVWTFIYRYVFRAGFLDGVLGLKLNTIYSDYVRKKIRYLREADRERQQSRGAEP